MILLHLALAWSAQLFAQTPAQQPAGPEMLRQQQTIKGGIGMTIVDGKPYYLFHLFPELTFGKIGIGLDVNIRVGEDGKIRHDDFDETYDYFRIIRYIRYGSKREPFYARAGTLDYARLGHGSIIYLYRNSPSYDLRKIGLELDADFETIGFESMYSDLGGSGVLGLRPYVRPLKLSTAGDIPVLGGMEVGATFASDYHEQATLGNGGLSIVGFDIGLPLFSISWLNSMLYSDYVKIIDYGNGATVGLDLNFTGLGVATLSAKYERRFMGDQFLPAYFNALYELERFKPSPSGLASGKIVSLRNAAKTDGYYGQIWLSVLGTFNVIGGYYSPVGVKNAGIMHFELETGNVLPAVYLAGGYDKKNVGSVFKVDNNSILFAEVGYKPYPYLLVSTLYQWTFVEKKENGAVVGYDAQRRVEPKVSFIFNF